MEIVEDCLDDPVRVSNQEITNAAMRLHSHSVYGSHSMLAFNRAIYQQPTVISGIIRHR
ncbi:hypothetical protein DPMN_079766 [Dreissena polymorpha]|uniref:Uncharacterized protein n=1 Tax=Dreissena polymorpha TaxID=45954 RepID=A0A9D4BQD7_DREPO|nr:hypothetical protein DPMN_079766 [Dreissena polymorpha]